MKDGTKIVISVVITFLITVILTDLAEGIRALLIDKDKQPRWRPANVGDVTAEWIAGFFASPWTAAQHPLADLGRERPHG